VPLEYIEGQSGLAGAFAAASPEGPAPMTQ